MTQSNELKRINLQNIFKKSVNCLVNLILNIVLFLVLYKG